MVLRSSMFCRVRPDTCAAIASRSSPSTSKALISPFSENLLSLRRQQALADIPFFYCVSLFSFSTCCITSKNSQCFDFHGLFLILFSRFLYCRETVSGIQRSCHVVFSMYLVSLIIPDEKLLFVEFVPRLVQWPSPGHAVLFAASCNIILVG